MIVDLVFDEPGVYAAVNHDYAAIYTGAATIFVAGDPFGLNPVLVDAGILEAIISSVMMNRHTARCSHPLESHISLQSRS